MKKNQRLLPILLSCLIITVHAAEITFSPQNPQVEIGGKITLSASGTSGAVIWSASKGQISGTGTQVTYWAPDQVGTDAVTVLDEADNIGVLKIIILPKDTGIPSQENANWEVFTDRSNVTAIVVSEDEKTLWVGTEGGLEQRDRATGELVRVFTDLDGLLDNQSHIRALYGDSSGGLWIGTSGGGLAYRSVGGEWTVYNTENAGLPDNRIEALYGDSSGGLWIGTGNSLAYRSVGGEWTVYNTDNALPNKQILALYGDSN
ncbi:MAG: two-component regulator propeller domain-containing protein, partial [Pseudomonadota bacterium]